jgi:hypothetical protein
MLLNAYSEDLFFRCERGYIGLAPAATQTRDQVCLLLGSDVLPKNSAPPEMKSGRWAVDATCVEQRTVGYCLGIRQDDIDKCLRFEEVSGRW